ncbi:MAG TPA: hypothetical protein VEO56_07100 [Bacteroidota bacterium]|nr:hypothetical protein [Bacteroidota bacterium]
MTNPERFLVVVSVALLAFPSRGLACACGCNVFTVGARWTMPTSEGLGAFLQYNYMDQSRNWGGWQSASAEANPDQEIRTHFYTLGMQMMIDRAWGVMVEAPLWDRYFRTLDDAGNLAAVTHTSFGDVRLMGNYTGLSDDMSTGFQFGLKVPTGSFTESLLDRDTQIGTGTIDILLGGYRMGQENLWGWYAQLMWQYALNTRDGYRPGDGFDVSAGVHYDGLLAETRIVPVLQIAATFRGIDSGAQANPDNTGYDRIYLAPGVQIVASAHLSIYADVRIPLMTHVRGNQLVAPALAGMTMGLSF